jgi:hypothetical protein
MDLRSCYGHCGDEGISVRVLEETDIFLREGDLHRGPLGVDDWGMRGG